MKPSTLISTDTVNENVGEVLAQSALATPGVAVDEQAFPSASKFVDPKSPSKVVTETTLP